MSWQPCDCSAEGLTLALKKVNCECSFNPQCVLSQDSYQRAKNLLKKYSKEHEKLADALLTYETLDAKEIKLVLEGKSLDPR